ncbi:MAG: hypothetical protein SO147_02260 [Clostridia bacterium]|nr:hypothetical protein [Clostridia bacterium]
MNRTKAFVFIAVVWIILLLPFAGMSLWPTNTTAENTPLAEIPSGYKEGKPNLSYLSDWGAYFEDHFAFRQQLVTANAKLYATLFKHSTTDQVILGEDGWLYYSGTLEDYQGENLFSERTWFALVHNLKLMQEYVESQGSRLLITVAPNKNSLYGAYMPSNYLAGTGKNIDSLADRLEAAGIEYVDLYSLFQHQQEPLYFQRDSHWNQKGAVLAYRALMEKMGKPHETYLNVPYSEKLVHMGDLDTMLYPLGAKPERDVIYERDWNFLCPTEDYMENWIETEQPDQEGTLLMFRDSFGESLLPFLAEEFHYGYFSRLVPYHLTQIEQYRPDFVVIERVERRLFSFASEAPVMPAPQRESMTAVQVATESTVQGEMEGSYFSVRGWIDPAFLEEKSEIYVSVRDGNGVCKTYLPFYLSSPEGEGYQMYLKKEDAPAGTVHVNVIVKRQEQLAIVASAEFENKEEDL